MTVEELERMSISEKVAYIEKSEEMAKALDWELMDIILTNMAENEQATPMREKDKPLCPVELTEEVMLEAMTFLEEAAPISQEAWDGLLKEEE